MTSTIATGDRCLRPKAAAAKLGIGVSTLWRYTKTDPQFPAPVRMSTRCVVFVESQLEEYLRVRADQSKIAA